MFTKARVFVKNLPGGSTDDSVRAIFEKFANVQGGSALAYRYIYMYDARNFFKHIYIYIYTHTICGILHNMSTMEARAFRRVQSISSLP